MNFLLRLSKGIYIVGAALIVFFFVWVGVWSLDRTPPFEMYTYTINKPVQGGSMEVHGIVRRDLDRKCSVKYTRMMYDSSGRRFWETPELSMSYSALSDMDAKMRSRLELIVSIPDDAPVGSVTMITDLQYKCNPIHALWPIQVTTSVETEILPAKTHY